MARRKRKEEADWVAPDFDEVGYMRREIQGAHAAVATILWAVVGASVAFLLFSVHPALAFLGGIAIGFGLYFILPLFGTTRSTSCSARLITPVRRPSGST